MKELGVGIIYFSGFKQVLESHSDLIQVIEIEPQTFWYRDRSESDSFLFNENELKFLREHSAPKIFHGVGYPVGGCIPPDDHHIPYLKKMIKDLNPVWLSEHLSFNTINIDGCHYNTNFLLPPLQTEEGVTKCRENIKSYSDFFDIPFAIETGTNYLKTLSFEIDDGRFFNKIVEETETHILLDVHNLIANERNGRQSVKDFLNQTDLSKVIQIHLAGGFYYDDYYLDAHSGVSSNHVIEIFEHVVERLPHLKAITFEMIPEYLQFVEKTEIQIQLETMNRVWDRRGIKYKKARNKVDRSRVQDIKGAPTAMHWEQILGHLVIGREDNTASELKQTLQSDPGLVIIQDLVEQFRKSLLVGSLKLTSRYLMLKYGLDGFNSLLRQYWSNSPTQLFASDNGIQFSNYLINQSSLIVDDLLLNSIVRYESASIKTIIDQQERTVHIQHHPTSFLSSLSKGMLPTTKGSGNFSVIITPDITAAQEKEQAVNIVHT